jgi:ABC-type uncharacterized transport system permease subunit
MDKRFGYYVFGGMLLGVFLGLIWTTGGNAIMGIVIGAVVGMAIGWFAAAYAMENEKEKKNGK